MAVVLINTHKYTRLRPKAPSFQGVVVVVVVVQRSNFSNIYTELVNWTKQSNVLSCQLPSDSRMIGNQQRIDFYVKLIVYKTEYIYINSTTVNWKQFCSVQQLYSQSICCCCLYLYVFVWFVFAFNNTLRPANTAQAKNVVQRMFCWLVGYAKIWL